MYVHCLMTPAESKNGLNFKAKHLRGFQEARPVVFEPVSLHENSLLDAAAIKGWMLRDVSRHFGALCYFNQRRNKMAERAGALFSSEKTMASAPPSIKSTNSLSLSLCWTPVPRALEAVHSTPHHLGYSPMSTWVRISWKSCTLQTEHLYQYHKMLRVGS